MSNRLNPTKPTVALWMLIAVGDVALIIASAGMVALIALASVVTVAVATVGAWLALHRSVPARNAAPARVPMSARIPVHTSPRQRFPIR
ncbi:hypothetical protein ACWDV4_03705 [Micromonospora sp. NPDC003197]